MFNDLDLARTLAHTRRAAEVHAAIAVRTGRAHRDDVIDIVQDGILGFLLELPKFDATRSSLPTYIERVVATRIASAIRHRRAKKRMSNHETWFAPPDVDFGETIELRVDVRRVLQGLAPGDRRIAEMLAVHSPAEAARTLGVARSTLYLAIERIRDAFIAAGIYRSFGPRHQRAEK